MVERLPMPKYDIVMWDGGSGIDVPPLYKIIEELGFELEYIEHKFKKTPFHKNKIRKIHKLKGCNNITMVFYDYKDEIDFYKDEELIYTVSGEWHCYVKRSEIIRELNISKII